ncbi:hypothetical protein [Ornithinibacillus scapharcae]|uniref:hypothetical protein n=1 Tax=Ornithinibacillus scapharcae TaxID=1147159 RepID=UPI000225BDFF|nr:hypothetical protein [Ornithinibacillus scapharcae]
MVTTIIVIYLISFVLILGFIYRGNKKESEEEKMSSTLVIVVSLLLALAPTIGLGFVLFTILGSANLIDMVFSLDLEINQLVILAISILVYLFTVDSIVEIVVEYIVGKKVMYSIVMLLSRIFAFYWIGLIVGFSQLNTFITATGIAVIISILELLYRFRKSSGTKEVVP